MTIKYSVPWIGTAGRQDLCFWNSLSMVAEHKRLILARSLGSAAPRRPWQDLFDPRVKKAIKKRGKGIFYTGERQGDAKKLPGDLGFKTDHVASTPEAFNRQLLVGGPFVYIGKTKELNLHGKPYLHAVVVTGIEKKGQNQYLFYNDPNKKGVVREEFFSFLLRYMPAWQKTINNVQRTAVFHLQEGLPGARAASAAHPLRAPAAAWTGSAPWTRQGSSRGVTLSQRRPKTGRPISLAHRLTAAALAKQGPSRSAPQATIASTGRLAKQTRPSKYLTRGMHGSQVAKLQRRLGLKTDGRFGWQTHAAVSKFQKRHGLAVDGVVGPKTTAKLFPKTTGTKPPQTAGYRSLLKFGTRRSQVADVQRRLGLRDDGIFGRNTLAAVRRFQKRNGLDVDGIVGPRTRAKLFSLRPATVLGRHSTFSPILKSGMRGPQVKALQMRLGVVADGIYGHNTAAAVRAFQRYNGLQADGIVGPRSFSKL